MNSSASSIIESTLEKNQLDRDWYDQNEDGSCVDISLARMNDVAVEEKPKAFKKRVSEKHLQNVKDTDRWEGSKLVQSGILKPNQEEYDPSADPDHNSSSVQLVVHEKHPPFIEGMLERIGTSEASGLAKLGSITFDPIQPVRDATSDMAQIARKGSRLVLEMRAKKEQTKVMRGLEGANTTLGNIMGKRRRQEDTYASLLSRRNEKSTDGEASKIADQRRFLPVYAVRSQLLRAIAENQVIVVVGETGSGKTTQLTQYLYEDGHARIGAIACTQPRRVAAMSVAKRVSEEMDCELGGLVGYAIRFEDCTSAETKIKYMTDGVLLRECLREPDADHYAAIIIDEAHERSLQTDILLGILREIVSRRRDLRVIVTSATMDAQKFSSFFGDAPVFTIPGRTYPVSINFASGVNEDYVDACVKQALSVHVAYPSGDILIFMTGQEDIEATCEAIKDRMATHLQEAPPLDILPIYSQLPADLQAKIFEPSEDGRRKCIVATNIAETSLTVDGIVYVIDSGFCKIKVYNPRIGMDALQIAPISQAGANQRAGRAGRTNPGHCFRMYTEQAYIAELFPNNIPEIARTNLSNAVLLLKSLNVENVLEFKFIDAPTSDALTAAMFQLWALGALSDEGRLTKLGKRMVEFPLDPPLAKMIIVADALGCLSEILTIVSMLSVPQVFYRPRERAELSDAQREKFAVPESDHLTLLNVFNQWRAVSDEQQDFWCVDHFIHAKALRRAADVRTQLEDIVKSLSINCKSTAGRNLELVRKCIASAHVAKAARIKSLGQYVNLRTGLPCVLHPTSSLFGLGYTPEYVVYHELLMTSKEYMQCVTAVDPEWLAESGPAFYSLRITEHTQSRTHQPLKRIVNYSTMRTPLRNANLSDEDEQCNKTQLIKETEEKQPQVSVKKIPTLSATKARKSETW